MENQHPITPIHPRPVVVNLTSMPELSPQAQAILDAYNAGFARPVAVHHKSRIAAALRAAADQLFPKPNDWDKDNMSQQGLWLLRLKRDQLLAISAELEGKQ